MSLRVGINEVEGMVGRLAEVGAWTPETRSLLVHDLTRMRARIHTLIEAFPPDTLHAVAVKANPLVEVLRRVVDAGAGLEAASWEEVALARAAGCPGDRIVFDGPAKTDDELRQALALGVWLNADHADELARLHALGAPGAAKVGVRVNPQLGAGSIDFTSTVSRSSKFGVPLDQAEELVRRFPFISGLHVHTGSQGCGLDLLSEAARRTSEVVDRLGLQWLDVGGGLPVRYTDADPEPPTIAAWADALSQTASWGRHRLLTELGRTVHAGCGIALSRIEAVKEIAGEPVVVVHLGADFLLRRVYRPNDWDHELVVLDPQGRPRGGEGQPTTVAGPLCFAGDVLARGRKLPPAQPGDLLLIRDVGAYTLAMWSRHCSRGMPAVWGMDGGEPVELFAGESPQDVVSSWSLRR